MIALGLKYEDLAAATGYARGTIKNTINGRADYTGVRRKVEEVLGIEIWESESGKKSAQPISSGQQPST